MDGDLSLQIYKCGIPRTETESQRE